MLCLTARLNDKIMINDDIVIQVTKMGMGQVCLGFEAPKHVKIYRQSIYEKILKEEGPQNE